MDVWALFIMKLFRIAPTNWGMVRRRIAYIPKGIFIHYPIATSAAIRGERIIGWVVHYLIGISYAAILVVICDNAWVHSPTVGPAIAVGIATVLAPFFIIQPGMGAGIAASRTAKPNSARVHSVINHSIFALGLYLSGWAVNHAYAL